MSGETGQAQRGDPNRKIREVAGRRILFDGEGFLWNPQEWSEELAEVLARESGLGALSDMHWKVIRFLREYYFHHGRAPLNVQLREGTGMRLTELEALFPGGIKRGARRIAGLPNPRSCTG